jgi:hypothetical protein
MLGVAVLPARAPGIMTEFRSRIKPRPGWSAHGASPSARPFVTRCRVVNCCSRADYGRQDLACCEDFGSLRPAVCRFQCGYESLTPRRSRTTFASGLAMAHSRNGLHAARDRRYPAAAGCAASAPSLRARWLASNARRWCSGKCSASARSNASTGMMPVAASSAPVITTFA